jgi:thermitase
MKRLFGSLLFLALPILLAACGGQPLPAQTYILTLRLQPTDSAQAIEQRYGGVVLSWQVKQGLAILKTEHVPAVSDTAVLHLENNEMLQTSEGRLGLEQPNHLQPTGTDQLQATGAATKSSVVGMSGWSVWSNGWGSWSNGWGSWSSGSNALPSLPSSNSTAFQSIRLPQAHAIAKKFGEGITVAVLDTGLDLTHPGVVGRLADPSLYWDFVGNDNNPSEEFGWGFGHGTAVTGLILQVAPAAKILPLRVLDGNGRGDLDDVISALNHAIAANVKVINVSLGSLQASAALDLMIQFARERQIYVVAAAGNASRQDQADYPAKFAESGLGWDYLFSIGSVNNTDQLSTFTNRGSDVSFYTPGESLTTFFPGKATINASGTSFSAPLVSGALALGLSQTLVPQALVGSYLRSAQEQKSIWWTVNNLGATPWVHSYGRLDLERFLLGLPGFVPTTARIGRTDFVRNGGFEQGLAGWTIGGLIYTDIFNDYFSGSTSVVLNRIGWVNQRLTDLQPNTTYVASAWIRVNRTSQSATFGVKNFGGSAVKRTVTGTPNFQKVTLEFTTGNTTTADLYFEKTLGTGIAIGDLFSVVRKSP